MEKLLKLKQSREAALARAEAAFAKGVKGVLAAADQKEFDEAHAEIDRLDVEIKAAQKVVDDEATAATAGSRNAERMGAARASRGSRTRTDAEGDTTPVADGGRRLAVVTNVRERVQDDPRRGFQSAGEFGLAVMNAMLPGIRAQDERLAALASISGMGQTVGADGGFLVPPEFSNAIWDGLNTAPDNLLGRTDQYTVQGESLTFPANAETSRATGSRYGGIQGYWLAEGSQMQGSKPKFRDVKLEPHGMAVLVYVTDKLLKNSPVALDQYLTRAATDEIAYLTGESIISGTGVGKPKGILNSACRVSIAKENAQAATTIVAANINKMWSRMHPKSRANAVWFINVDIEPQLELLTMNVGTGGIPIYLPPGGIADAPNSRLKGRPVIPIEYCETLGTEGDIILADLKAYASGTRGGVEAAMSMHLRFDYNESAFRFLFEVDGQPWLNSAITPAKGSNTLSPFVTLAVRA